MLNTCWITPNVTGIILYGHEWSMTERSDMYGIQAVRMRRILNSSWNVMAHGDARRRSEGGNWRMECVASTLHTTSAASSRLNWRPRRFEWTSPFRQKTKSGFCAFAITFQLAFNTGEKIMPMPIMHSSLSLPFKMQFTLKSVTKNCQAKFST